MLKLEQTILTDLSPMLFWDTDRRTVDVDANAAQIIQRVLEYGSLNDWYLIRDYYTIPVIAERAKELRTLDERALSFIAAVSHTPKEQFRCYIIQQSQSLPCWY
jgi:hypothetical protein